MPYYEYLCEKINQEFEAEHSINTVLNECPLCKESGREQHAPKRLISLGGKGVVEQSFDEFKSSIPSEVKKIQQKAATNENFLSNLIGNKYQG